MLLLFYHHPLFTLCVLPSNLESFVRSRCPFVYAVLGFTGILTASIYYISPAMLVVILFTRLAFGEQATEGTPVASLLVSGLPFSLSRTHTEARLRNGKLCCTFDSRGGSVPGLVPSSSVQSAEILKSQETTRAFTNRRECRPV